MSVTLKRSARARRFTLRVSRSTGKVSLSLPNYARDDEAIAFLQDRSGWVRAQLASCPPVLRPELGGAIPVHGIERPIVSTNGRQPRFDAGRVEIPFSRDPGPAVSALFKQMARDALVPLVQKYADMLHRPIGRITLRDTRSRWGSCSSRGDLMFSWRLVMAPPAVQDYVAAHEVAHLEEMNHSAAYWRVCASLCPSYETHRAWLRREGAALQAWQFDGTN